jgi:ABC-2 type transport system permease protein
VWDGHARLRKQASAYELLLAQEAQAEQSAAAKAAASEQQLRGASIGSVDRYVRHGPTHPQWVGRNWSFRVAAMPPPALGHLAIGKLDVTPTVYRMRTDRLIEDYRLGELTAHPLQLFTGAMDPTTVMLFLMPLLVIALGADLVTGERERGTFDLLRSNPVSVRSVVLIRLAARAGVTLVPLVIFAAATSFIADATRDGAWAMKLAIWLAASVLYLAVWWAATLLTSVRARTTASAALILSTGWVVTLLVVPSSVRLALDWLVPIPSRATLIQAQRTSSARADATPAKRVLAAYLQSDAALLKRYGALLPETDSFGFASGQYYLVGEARDFQAETDIRPVLERWQSAKLQQERLARWLSLLSPAMLAQSILLDTVGTSDRGLAHFRHAVSTFHAEWRAFFLPRVFEMRPLGPEEYRILPRFTYRVRSVLAVMADAVLPLLALASLAAGLIVCALQGLAVIGGLSPQGAPNSSVGRK